MQDVFWSGFADELEKLGYGGDGPPPVGIPMQAPRELVPFIPPAEPTVYQRPSGTSFPHPTKVGLIASAPPAPGPGRPVDLVRLLKRTLLLRRGR